ncbi:MAG TPA: NAD-dependent epimerase/dehydratase family protein [Acidobacteriota bacterium]|nr:NAD-dependent epimerase/dehydratase family protein [Acidobacteriota bacterium]HQF86190.1 NAD-dependent epimerase/dehydratase family protein [Acidobacteriota bacterium]HQG90566.1 NAD-dependent epimerase/dehydratase family protein [Acidobacteriota bacterium]HQK86214.1 NAD-dependent epimerase/dehydratase family protein [Acidobacteriota bacterium]
MFPRSVVVTGANGQVGGRLLAELVQRGIMPTALVRKAFVVEGCRSIANWLVVDAARDVIRTAEAVVHLAGALNPPDHDYMKANVLPADRLIQALEGGRARLVVFLSYLGASETAANPYLQTKARAEQLIRDTRIPLAVFRCAHIIGPPEAPGPTASALLAGPTERVTVLGSGRQRVAPVFIGDVVNAILAALESGESGIFDLQGPEEMAMDDLVRLLNRNERVPIRHIPAILAQLLQYVGPKLPGGLIDIMLRDSRSEKATAAPALGLRLNSLRQVWS